jgi:alginate O-acetyltransferase complex protein AlgI
MLFNSIQFLLFFPLVTIIYFLLPFRFRWLFLLVASYYFYMNWMPVYAVLIFISTLTTYICSLYLDRYRDRPSARKLFMTLSLVFNFAILFLFKYYNFINETVFYALSEVGLRWYVPNLDILLPVGISFYTFQAVGYTIDVYRGDLPAEKHFGRYALFVSFFPQLVAGPIERATELLPQFRVKHVFQFDRFLSGFTEMLWGFFMKVCIADRLALYVNAVYGNVDKHHGTTFILATILFAFQIYCDFAGYSKIALGAARIMGFELMHNFRRPYFSASISEFWKRWHISLSTWFRDYVYIPLGGNRVKYGRHLFNLLITFLVSGIWHGANWTFALWGVFHGAFLIVAVLRDTLLPSVKFNFRWINVLWTFILVNFAWIFFRANSVQDAFSIVRKILTSYGVPFLNKTELLYGLTCLGILLIKEIKDEMGWRVQVLTSENLTIRYTGYVLMIYLIVLFGVVDSNQFIYFQF